MKVATFTVKVHDELLIKLLARDSVAVGICLERLREGAHKFAIPGYVTVTFEGIADDAASPDKQENT